MASPSSAEFSIALSGHQGDSIEQYSSAAGTTAQILYDEQTYDAGCCATVIACTPLRTLYPALLALPQMFWFDCLRMALK